MSLHKLAKKVQSTGRGQDSMLVHMSPREVRGLQQLARIKGGTLTTNPETGLPEAGFLEDILPMVAAGAAIYFTGGAAAGALGPAGFGLSSTTAGILGGAGAGALIGGGSAAIQGKDVGNAALMGGLTGAIGGGISGAMGGAPVPGADATGAVSQTAGTSAAAANAPLAQATAVGTNPVGVNPATGMGIDPLAAAPTPTPTTVPQIPQITPAQAGQMTSSDIAGLERLAAQRGVLAEGAYQLPGQGLAAAPAQIGPQTPQSTSTTDVGKWWDKQTPLAKAGYSTLGAGLVAGLNAPPNTVGDADEDYTSSLQRISPNFRAQEPVQPNPYYRARYPTYAAEGGLMDAYQAGGPVERMSQMNTAMSPQGGLYPQGMIDKTQYATPIQRPVSSELVMDAPAYERSNPMLMSGGGQAGSKKKERADLTPESNIAAYDPYTAAIATVNNARNRAYLTKAQMPPAAMRTLGGIPTAAKGGLANLGGYSDGGRMLKGPGDGMSDSIPGVIGGKQPARLADGEFVVPADVVSHLGNGSTDAGAKRLYAMMAKVRKARTGKKKQAPAVNTARFLPA